MQRAAGGALADGALAEAERPQLTPRDDAVLVRREPRDRRIKAD